MWKTAETLDPTTPHPLQWAACSVFGKTPDAEGETTDEDTGGDSDGNENTDQVDIDRIIGERTARYRRQLDEAKKTAESTAAKLAEYEKAEDDRRQQELEEQGKYQQLLEERDAKFKVDLQSKDAQVAALQAELNGERISRSLSGAVAAVPGIKNHVVPLIEGELIRGVALGDTYLKVKSERNELGGFDVVVVDSNDSRLTNGRGEFMTAVDAVKKVVEYFPEFIHAEARTGSGAAGAGNDVPGGELQRKLEAATQAAKAGSKQAVLEVMRLEREIKQQGI